jgi:hypothetical protein
VKRLADYAISNSIELLYAKTVLKNLFKTYPSADPGFLEFALMELGNNLLKHAFKGRILILLYHNTLALATVDEGPGIADISLALRKGHTTVKHSLGIGLSSLASRPEYRMGIVSLCRQNGDPFSGSVVTLLESHSEDTDTICILSNPLYDSPYNGDFFVRKGKYLFFADVSGHGKKAYDSSIEAIRFFLESHINRQNIPEFFKGLHTHLLEKHLRSLVGCIINFSSDRLDLFGVGNISVFSIKNDEPLYHTFVSGIVGETFEEISTLTFKRFNHDRFIIMSDGIDPKYALSVLSKTHNVQDETLAVALTHFAGINDDQTVLIISSKGNRNDP